VTLFSSTVGPPRPIPDLGCRQIRIPKRNYTVLGQLSEQARLIARLSRWKEARPDAIYVRAAYTVLAPILYAMWKRVPYFLEVNALAERESSHPRLLPLAVKIEDWSLRHSRRTLVVTEELKAHFVRRTGLPADRFVVMPNGVDDTLIEGGNGNPMRGDSRPTVGFLGTFQNRQGVGALIRAIPEVLSAIPETQFVVAGDGPEFPRYRKLVSELGLDRIVRFPGFVEKPDVRELIRSFDVAVAPFSPLQDALMGSPIKLYTYLALGRTVVTSDLPSLRVFRDCPAVLFAEPENEDDLAGKIVEALSLPEDRRREFGRKGQEYVARGHTWGQIARRTSEIILASLENQDQRPGGFAHES
jgi:glycosyltransferase involved in cell wall biosynthesis